MSKRPRIMRQQRITVPAHSISDKSKLLWERYWNPMNGAAQALNAAISNTQNLLASIIMEMEGFDPKTHVFDMDNMRIIPRPKTEIPQIPQVSNDNGAVE